MAPERLGAGTPSQANSRWRKGHSGNPSGRTAGSRNRATFLAVTLLEGKAEAIARSAVERAKTGDIMAAKFCLKRLLPL